MNDVHWLNAEDAPLRLGELPARAKRIAIARLNSERTLNALSLPMIEILSAQLAKWEQDERVALLWIEGAGARAFAAGGDVQALYAAIKRNADAGAWEDDYPDRFFEQEYRLDYQLHCFAKPMLAWGHGFVMGGGLGVFGAAAFRAVTETTRIALPEVTIGLFPDAGASWLLRNMPYSAALWLGLTGSRLSASDAIYLQLASHFVPDAGKAALLQSLQAYEWHSDQHVNRAALNEAVSAHAAPAPAPGPMQQHGALFDRYLGDRHQSVMSVADSVERLLAAPEIVGDAWFKTGGETFRRGCPTTVHLLCEQLRRVQSLSLAECFALELTMAHHCARNGEFAEGVRALLVDRDNQPNWRYPILGEVPAQWVAHHFNVPWAKHPLADLAG